MTSLRPFNGVPQVVRKAEGKQFCEFFFVRHVASPHVMTAMVPLLRSHPPEIGELIGIPNAGRLVHRLVHNFPKLQYVCISTCVSLSDRM